MVSLCLSFWSLLACRSVSLQKIDALEYQIMFNCKFRNSNSALKGIFKISLPRSFPPAKENTEEKKDAPNGT